MILFHCTVRSYTVATSTKYRTA